MPQERRPIGIRLGTPLLQYLHLLPAKFRLQKVCIRWWSSNHACQCRLVGSGRGA